MPKLKVNGKDVEFDSGMTVLQACEIAGEEIPRFCYHERLKIAGNCRMCLVQIEGGPPKPAASCAMPAAEGMVVHTNTPVVKKAREGVMEFLLANHPLDCPICDQGGECDLQDQSMLYGNSSSRYDEKKRAVKDKYMGPLIKTHMTRCIHCTRCVRFLEDVGGVYDLGVVYRGEKEQISTYVEKSITSELSGNIIDLCPVGALTSKPYAFKARPWELNKTTSIDVLDAVGSNIRVDSRGREVMRVLPRLNEDVNEEWISDKARFSYDGLGVQRLDRPFIKKGGKLKEASWDEAYGVIAKKLDGLKGNKIAAIAGDMVDVESMFALKELFTKLGSPNIDCRQDGANFEIDGRASYLFNTTIAGIEQADACLIIGSDPRVEAAILNARIRKAVNENDLEVALIGEEVDLAYKYQYLGNKTDILREVASGKNAFSKVLKKAKNPMLIIGSGVLAMPDADAIIDVAKDIVDKFSLVTKEWNGFNILHRAASRVGGIDIGFLPGEKGLATSDILKAASKGKIEFLYLLGADEIDAKDLSKSFVVYQGHHGDKGAHLADVILPGASYTEKNGTYVNLEGRAQLAYRAVFPPGGARDDVEIILKLSDAIGSSLGFESDSYVRGALAKISPVFANIGELSETKWKKPAANRRKISAKSFKNPVENFYMTNPISRASTTMAKCVSEILEKSEAA